MYMGYSPYQARGQDGSHERILASFFFFLPVAGQKKKGKKSQYLVTLPGQHSHKGFIIWFEKHYFLPEKGLIPSTIPPAWVANHRAAFGLSCLLEDLAMQ